VTNRYFPISADPLCFLSTDGPRRTHVGEVVKALNIAGIDRLTALSYGQKSSIEHYAWLHTIDVGRQSAHGTTVELDVGVNTEPIAHHESSVIVVRDRQSCVWPGTTKHYAMFWSLARAGSGVPFGTFRLSGTRARHVKQVAKYYLFLMGAVYSYYSKISMRNLVSWSVSVCLCVCPRVYVHPGLATVVGT